MDYKPQQIETANGLTDLAIVNCEVTGQWLGWQTVLPEEAIQACCTPAFITFYVLDEEGVQHVDITHLDSF